MNNFLKHITWAVGVFFVGTMILLVSLGVWQLDRAAQKRLALSEQQQVLDDKSEMVLTAETDDDLALMKYRSVTVTGHYDTQQQFLLDNQHLNGKVGYFVLTPLKVGGSNKAVLVNRGWLPLNLDRTILPAIPVTSDVVTIKGRVNSFPSVGVKLEGAETPTDQWPSIVQVVATPVLANKLGYALYSFQLELDPGAEDGYQRVWHAASIMPPEKHVAYAVQWFGLAITFAILFFWLIYKKQVDDYTTTKK